jgi:hypothetical protein
MRFFRNSGLYEEYENKGFNSHSRASLRKYKNMLSTYTRLIAENDYQVKPEIVKAIIKAAY